MIEKQCPVCNKIYLADPKRLLWGRQTTCSRECSYAFRAQNKTTSVTHPCAICGKPVTRPPSVIAKSKTEAFLCSRACHYAARSDGTVGRVVVKPYSIPEETRKRMATLMRARSAIRVAEGRYKCSEETKAKLSISLSRAIASGRFPKVSKFEINVGKILTTLGVNFQSQHAFRDPKGRFGAVVDFYFPDWNVVLEANGTFWHSDPRSYPNGPISFLQKHNAIKYTQKKVLLTALGIQLFEIWEFDFQNSPEQAVKSVLSLIESADHTPLP